MINAILPKTRDEAFLSNDNYCAATLSVSSYERPISTGTFGEHSGCVFKVGDDMYFVPTQQVAEEDMLYITCDAQKIEGSFDGWRSTLSLGDIAAREIEDAILGHLHSVLRVKKQGECFVITREGKTFRL
jgi:hypothetical protein